MGRFLRSRSTMAAAAFLLLAVGLPGAAGDPCPVPYQPDASGNKLVLTGSPFDGLEVGASYLRKAGDDAPLVVYEGDLAVAGASDLFSQRPLDGWQLTSLGVAAAAGPGGYTIEGIYDSLALFFDSDPALPLQGVAFEGGAPPNRVDPQPAGYQISRRGTKVVFPWTAQTGPCECCVFYPYFATIETTTGNSYCYGVDYADQFIADWRLSSDRSWLVYVFRDDNSSISARVIADHLDFVSSGQLQSTSPPDVIGSAPNVQVRDDGLALTHGFFDFATFSSELVSLGVGFPVRTLSTGNDIELPTTHFSNEGDSVAILHPYDPGGPPFVTKLLVGSMVSGPTLTIEDPSVDDIDGARFTPGETHFAFTSAASTLLFVSPVADGGPVTQVPTAGNTIGEFGFTPDAATLLFTEERASDQALELWAVGVGGGTPASIGPFPVVGATGVTEWTFADGRLIVYGSFDGLTSQLYSMETDGSDLQLVQLPDPSDSVAGYWIFDGGIVLKLEGSSQLWLAPAVGGEAIALTLPGIEDDVSDPQVAEDGSFFIYDARIAGADRETVIYFVDSDLDFDGVPNTVDNCLSVPNTDQADTDGDCAGDVCDACPLDPLNDEDGDLLCAQDDNCPSVYNPDQADADADSVGDVCDPCTDLDGDGFGDPGFPANTCAEDVCPTLWNPGQDDGDQDGLGSACDNCPALFNPEQRIATSQVLSAPLQPNGDAVEFALSPDGSYTVYLADQEIDETFELYSVPTAGGPVVKLNPPLASNEDVLDFAISPLGDLVAYRTKHYDPTFYYGLYVVPIAGGTSVNLSGSSDVWDFRFTPNGERVVYRTDQSDLYEIPVTGGPSPHLLNRPDDNVVEFAISPDNQRVVYRGDTFPGAGITYEILSVELRAGGAPVVLNGPLVTDGDVLDFLISPDGVRVVYRADQDTNGVEELYGVDITGGSATKLNGTLANLDVHQFYRISPDSARVVYHACQDTPWVGELYSVLITGGATSKLNGPLPPEGDVYSSFFAISPDSAHVVYRADQDTVQTEELYRAAMLGGESVKLSGPLVPGGDVGKFGVSLDGTNVAYTADARFDGVTELFGVSLTGGPVTRLSGELTAGGDVDFSNFAISPDGRYAVYMADQDTDQTSELYAAPFSGGPYQKLNGVIVPGGDVQSFLITSGSDTVVYRAIEAIPGVPEIYRVALEPDADSDGIVDVCDCAPGDPGAFNEPTEVTGLLLDEDRVTLVWASGSADAGPGLSYDLVRGAVSELPVGAGAAEVCVDTGITGTSYEDTFEPAAGEAAFYVLRAVNVCGVGTYGFASEPGLERLTDVCP